MGHAADARLHRVTLVLRRAGTAVIGDDGDGGRDPVQYRRKLGACVRSSWSAGTWPARLRHRDDFVEHLPVRRAGAGGELWPQVPSLSSIRELVARRLAASC